MIYYGCICQLKTGNSHDLFKLIIGNYGIVLLRDKHVFVVYMFALHWKIVVLVTIYGDHLVDQKYTEAMFYRNYLVVKIISFNIQLFCLVNIQTYTTTKIRSHIQISSKYIINSLKSIFYK